MQVRLFCFGVILSVIISSCLKDDCESNITYSKWSPVYVTEDGLRPDITNEGPRNLSSPGKIYTYLDYLFINELREGVHVIDNSDPSNPTSIGFIGIPGNIDISIRGKMLYADMFRDLVTIDISNITEARLVDRQENVFESFIPFDETEGKYIIEYESTRETVIVDCSDDQWGSVWFRGGPDILVNSNFDAALGSRTSPGSFASNPTSGSAVGTGGSLARFTISKDHLYSLDDSRINVFDVHRELPDKKSIVEVGWGIETIFPYDEYLFIGSRTGMFIYDTKDPAQPKQLSVFTHARACDPVFVDGNIAYVTLRDGGPCTNQVNQIDVIDVSNLKNPKLLKSFGMDNPHGLSVLDDMLYLCEGESGLKVFDVSEPTELYKHLTSHIKDHHSYDVIALSQGVLLVIGEDGLYQYNISDPSSLQLLSVIHVDSNK